MRVSTHPPAPELPPKTDEKKVKMSCYLQPSLVEALQLESVKRKMTLGELVEEALRSRSVNIKTW